MGGRDDPPTARWLRAQLDRLILNPHAAFYSEEGLMDMRIKGSENCRRALLGQPLQIGKGGLREGIILSLLNGRRDGSEEKLAA